MGAELQEPQAQETPVQCPRTELILADKIPADPVLCPRCKGNTFALEGCYRRTFRSFLEKGVEVNEELGQDTCRDIDVLLCPVCKVRFLIADETTYRLYAENMELRTEVVIAHNMASLPVVASKKPN